MNSVAASCIIEYKNISTLIIYVIITFHHIYNEELIHVLLEVKKSKRYKDKKLFEIMQISTSSARIMPCILQLYKQCVQKFS